MRPWRPAFALLAMLAVFLQAFVVQTHVHAPVAPLSIGFHQAARAHDDAAHVTARDQHQLVCAICQTVAASSSALPPSAAVALVAAQTNSLAVIALSIAPRATSYSWRSRAPPSFL
ncbi:MAG: hypothetical protein AB7G40_00860 [Hyphomonadaceae bacterium]